MVVGYAAFQTRLEIKGTSKVTSNWDIEITNVTDGKSSGSAENTTKPSWTKLTASMEANLYDKGDAMEYDVTIENKGTIDAKLNDILTNLKNSNSDAVIITFSGYTKGEVLKAKESKIVHVKIAYNPDYDGDETSSEVTIDFDYTQDNKSEDAPKTYLLTYDYKTNGGDRVDSEGEYLTSGSNANLSNVAYKQGWIFVGWNTNKNAEVGLTSYQMKEQSTTLYAIYSKTLKATYEKGSNIESIGKEEDSCTIYNNETSCEITLPSITPNEGYVIDGWYNGNNKVGSPNDKYSLKSNITLTSKVKQNTYTVTYDYKTNGGTSSTKETDKVNYGEAIDLTPTASKSGWTFVGWNTNKDATTGLTSLKMNNSNVTLYAIYRKEAKTITITFNKNGSTSQTPSGGSANSNTTLTQSCTIPAVYNNATQASSCNITSPTINASSNTPTVVGYNTSASATTSSWNQNTSKAVSANATYYAITRKDAVTLTAKFNANGASLSSADNQTCTLAATYNGNAQATSCTVTAPTITRSGYTIVGYNTSASSTSNSSSYNTSSKVLTLTSSNNNSTWYAITSKKITITFDKNGASSIGSTSQSCTMYNTSESCDITSPTITSASGFSVLGWNTTSGSTSSAWTQNTSKSFSSNATYYAITRSSNQYTATFNENGATIGSTSQSCYRYNGASSCNVTTPSITRSGFTITGWGTSASATSAAVKANASLSLTANKTYYAVTSKVVTVTYSKGSNVSSIGSTSGTCTIQNSATNCQVTLPSITASSTYIADGWYSGNTRVGSVGAKYTVSNNTTLTAQAKADNITLSISTTNTTNSITVVANATADSGMAKYEFSKDGGKTWVNGGTSKTYTFNGLTQVTAYNIQVRVTSNSGKTSSTSKSVTTSSLAKPTFSENTNGDVVISYPSGCTNGKTCSYSQNNGNNVTVTGSTILSFGADGTVVATVTDGTNTVSSTYTFIKRDLYVSSSGSDTTGYGTKSKPYATLTKAYDSATSTTEATIYVMDDLNSSEKINMNANKNIVLTSENDEINKVNKAQALNEFLVNLTSGNLTLRDIIFDGKNIEDTRGFIRVDNNVKLNILNNAIIQNFISNAASGAAIRIEGREEDIEPTVTIDGGSVINNKALCSACSGGGINVDFKGNLIINSGKINNNTATGEGGGIYSVGKVYLNGGEIIGNTSEKSVGGGISIDNGTFTITSGTVKDNIASSGIDTQNLVLEADGQHSIIINDEMSNLKFNPDKNYVFTTALDERYAAVVQNAATAIETNVISYTWGASQKHLQWKPHIISIDNDLVEYSFEVQHTSNRWLWVYGNSSSANTRIVITTLHANLGGYWNLVPQGNNYFQIKSILGTCMGINGTSVSNNTAIVTNTCTNNTNQKWKLVEVD